MRFWPASSKSLSSYFVDFSTKKTIHLSPVNNGFSDTGDKTEKEATPFA